MQKPLRRLGVPSVLVFLLAAALPGSAAAQSPLPFSPLETPTPETIPAPIGVGDVNGDGSHDLIVVGPPYVYLNDGHGRFLPASGSAGIASNPGSTAIADFNADGRADLVQINGTGVSFWLGTVSNGLVAAPAMGFTFTGGRAISVGDINGDGAPDFILGTLVPTGIPQLPFAPGPNAAYLNNGTGAFSAIGTLGIPPLGGAGAAFADLDLDGDQDLLVCRAGTSNAGVAFNSYNVNGTFGGAIGVFGSFGLTKAMVAHLNADAYPDLVEVLGDQAFVSFGSPGGFTGFPTAIGAVGIGVIDLNLDGVDEVTAGYDTQVIAYSIGAGGAPTAVLTLQRAGGSILAADFDSDGDRDILIRAASVGVTWEYFSNGQGALILQGPVEPLALRGGPVVLDANGDGIPDLVGTAWNGAQIRLAIAANDGVGRFTWSTITPAGAPLSNLRSWVVAPDLDADGDRDLVVFELGALASSFWQVSSRVVTNLGGGSWSAASSTLFSGGETMDATVADMNNDLAEDVVYCDTSNGVRILYASGGSLVLPGAVISAGLARRVTVADMDLDGDLDIVVAGQPSLLLLNDGSGSFTPDPFFPSQTALFCTTGDVNGDGFPDVYLDRGLFVRQGASWIHMVDIPSQTASCETRSFDFDGDGDIDTVNGSGLAFVDAGLGLVINYTLAIPPETNGSRLMPVDLDRDGDLDLVTAPPILSPGYTSYDHFGAVLFNTSRQLTQDAPTRPGRPTHTGLRGLPGGNWLAYAASGLGTLPVPPYGTVLIDLVSAFQIGAGTLDASGKADLSVLLPPSFSTYVGLEFDVQALVDTVGGPRLTNARRVVISQY